jgi:molybdate-binding protein/transcriptional regulator with XRE-family HTH domain
MILSHGFSSRVRDERTERGWSQQHLAGVAGLSRAAVSAIETGRVIPSAAAALSLANALGCSVERLFRIEPDGATTESASWSWAPGAETRYWLVRVGSEVVRVPVEGTAAGVIPHDGVYGSSRGNRAMESGHSPDRTLLVAGCDPAIGLLAARVAASGIRLLPLTRSSGQALRLLRDGLVHVAGMHLGDGAEGNAAAAREVLGGGFRRVHVARWREGLALSPGTGHATVGSAVRGRLRWVGREEGSGARCCQDLILEGAMPEGTSRIAADHRGVVETIRTGWAQAGVCVELTAREAGLDFLAAREADYELCYPESLEDDPRLVSLMDALRTHAFRRCLADLPGYDCRRTGDRA